MLAEIRRDLPIDGAVSHFVEPPALVLPAGARRRVEAYQDVERRAVAWVAERLASFDPANFRAADRMFTHKALVELALLAAYRVRLDPAPLTPDYTAILDHVERVAARGSYRDLVARDHRAFLLYALTYAALRVCGRDDDEFRVVIQRAVGARYALLRERVPFRQLDLLHFLSLAGIDAPVPRFEEIFPLTILAGDPNLIDLEDLDAYAITHTLFYLTDFGLRAPNWPAGLDPRRAVDLVTALLRQFRLRDNADLTGELIMSSVCLGARRSPEMDRGWRYLRGKQADDGRVPGPPGVIDEAQAEALGGAAYREWKTSYHTTLVVALAALMARRAEAEESYPAMRTTSTPQPRSDSEPARGEAVAAAVGWLCRQVAAGDLPQALRAGAGIAIGLGGMDGAAATAANGAELGAAAAHAALGEVAARLEGVPAEEPLWSLAGADTLLLLACGLRQAGLASSRLDAELDHLAGGLDADSLAGAPDAFSAGALLVRLGKLDAELLAAAARRLPALAPRPAAGETAAAFSARLLASGGGDPARLAGGAARWRRTREWLAAEVVRSCRDYRLDEAALIARGLWLAGGEGDRVLRDALDYLISQQKPDGSFGYFARDGEDELSGGVRLNWTLAVLSALVQVWPVSCSLQGAKAAAPAARTKS